MFVEFFIWILQYYTWNFFTSLQILGPPLRIGDEWASMVKTITLHIRFDLRGRKMHGQRRATGHLVTVSTKLPWANGNKTSSQEQGQKEKVKQNAINFRRQQLIYPERKLCWGICCCRCYPGRLSNAVIMEGSASPAPRTDLALPRKWQRCLSDFWIWICVAD